MIEAADVVFVCGKSNTGLTTVSLKVGEMQCVKKTKLNKKQTSLVVINNELSTRHLMNLAALYGLSPDRQVMYMFENSTCVDTLNAFKSTQAVGVIETVRNTQYNDILFEMAKFQSSGLVITHRFMTHSTVSQDVSLMRLKSGIWEHGLKTLFVETRKDPETGLINLDFSDRKL